jgi:hypothetical protein
MAEEWNGLHLVRHVQIEGEPTGRLEGGQLQQLPHHHLRYRTQWCQPERYISRGPTFGDSMQDNTVARLKEYKFPSPPSIICNVMYFVRVSLRTVKIFLTQH